MRVFILEGGISVFIFGLGGISVFIPLFYSLILILPLSAGFTLGREALRSNVNP